MNMHNPNWSPWPPAASSQTLRDFMASTAVVRGLMGPVGGGKTICCLTDLFHIAVRQEPDNDGVRRTRFLVVRDTYGNLENTTLKSFRECYPQPDEPGVVGVTMTGGKNRQSVYDMKAQLSDGTQINMQIIFAAIGDISAETFMKGFELTAIFLSEGDGLSPDVLQFGMGRIGRYPSKKNGPGPTYFGILIDFNAPTFDNYLYPLFFEGDKDIYKLFMQPSGVAKNAENTEHHSKNYYTNMIKANSVKWVKRNVHNQFGFSDHGKPVYPEFNPDVHVADHEFEPIEGLMIYVGMDAGRTPTAILGQVDSEGQLRIFDEVYRQDMGAETFAQSLKDYIIQRYGWDFNYKFVGDPNAGYKTETSDLDWLTLVGNILGSEVKPANTNRPSLRIEAVKSKLSKNISGTKPYMLISPRCTQLVAGFVHGYQFKKLVGSNDNYSPQPNKNEYSHYHDACQYLALEVTSNAELVGKSLSKKPAHRPKPKQRSLMSTKPRRRGRR